MIASAIAAAAVTMIFRCLGFMDRSPGRGVLGWWSRLAYMEGSGANKRDAPSRCCASVPKPPSMVSAPEV
jgi:hypothetical protein